MEHLLASNEDQLMRFLFEDNLLIPTLAIICGSIIAIIAIVFTCVKGMVVGKVREQTKRELAAYVAEGTVQADHAVAILNAGQNVEEISGPAGLKIKSVKS